MTTQPRRSGVGWHALALASLLVGTFLRAWQIDIQILIDDEWHAIHKLLASTPLDIVTHLGYADYSIPLTLYYQSLYRTIGLSEWGMHAPSLFAGIALLVAGPRLLARWAPLPVRAIWVALVAVSPLLVYHSKVARPYALTSLLTFIAIIAFRTWWRRGRARDAALYVATTVLAGWLHAITLPFTLLPFAYYGLQTLVRAIRTPGRHVHAPAIVARRRRGARRARRLVAVGLATLLPLMLALLPPFIVDWEQFAGKAARGSAGVESLYRTLLMLAGTGSPVVGAIVAGLTACGFVGWLRRDRDLAFYLATIVGVATAVIVASGPEWITHPLVLARYLLPALPFVLLAAAEGIAIIVGSLRRSWVEPMLAGAFAAGLLMTGPIPGEWHYPNQFWGHLRYQLDYDPAHNPYVQQVSHDPLPAFYRDLGRLPPASVTLIEAPWLLESHFNPQSLYQDVHRQLIKIGLTSPLCGGRGFGDYPETRTGMRMRELVHLSALLRGETHGGDYLVLHLHPRNVATDPGREWPDITRCLPLVRERFGAPFYRDGEIEVYRLAAVSPLGNNRRPVQQ